MKTTTLTVIFFFICFCSFSQPGTKDNTFGNKGYNLFEATDSTSTEVIAMAIQPDGKIVTAGNDEYMAIHLNENTNIIISRLTSDGFLDPSFGINGMVDFSENADTSLNETDEIASDVLIQPDGKIVVAGWHKAKEALDPKETLLLRLNADGSFDNTFGVNGVVILDLISGTSDYANAVALQEDGKIVITGTADNNLFIARYNSDGSLDGSFGDAGIVYENGDNPIFQNGTDISVDQDGKILVLGSAYVGINKSVIFLARYHTNGKADKQFGEKGKAKIDFYPGAFPGYITSTSSKLAIMEDGNIVISANVYLGYYSRYISFTCLAKLKQDGSLNRGFADNGKVLMPSKNYDVPRNFGEMPLGMIVTPEGKIVLSLEGKPTLAFFQPNGRFDTTVDIAGFKTFPINGKFNALALQSDGKFVAGGTNYSSALVARFNYENSGTLNSMNRQDFSSSKIGANLSIVPNPASNFIQVNGLNKGKGIIQIYNSSAKIVHAVNFDNETIKTIDVHNFPSGIYYLKIIEGNNINTLKFIKQ